MKSQIGFLTPIIAGIVIGITTMIVTILGKLTTQLTEAEFGAEAVVGTTAGFQGLLTLFEIKNIIPSYYLQLIVGLYLVEVTIVLTILTNGIENGADDLAKENSLGKNLYRSSLLYIIVAFFTTLIFTLLAANIKLGT